jgi:RimJ/RimL family protein N-acetyltransferase
MCPDTMREGIADRLTGSFVTLERLAPEHADELRLAGAEPAIWRWMRVTNVEDWLEATMHDETLVPFVTRVEGVPRGSTSYLALRPADRSVEIGNTWLHPADWGTGANTEAKLLMLRHAFEELGCLRVEFKTDALNERSRAALAALPSQFEGIHRRHMLVRGGERRDSAWYSVIVDEWPEVQARLEERLTRR